MTKPIDLDELERKAKADSTALDGLHGDPSKRGWIGHRDHARHVVALIARIRELEAIVGQVVVALEEVAPANAAEIRAVLARGAVLP